MTSGLSWSKDSGAVRAAASALAGVDQVLTEPVAVQVLARSFAPEYGRWQRLVSGSGFCARPVRLAGRKTAVGSNGRREVVYSTGDEPDGALLVRCGNRRASVCPPCSRTYAGDVWHLLHAGVAGGSKGVPESVAGHPMWFVTLTGPGFGAVHGERCGRGREGRSASGGRTGRALVTCLHGCSDRCGVVHGADDAELGEPVCAGCYDYPGAVAFNWYAPELWRRFTIALRRRVAARLGIAESRLGERLRVSFAKVAEFQRRGVVHFHAIIRLDGPAAAGDYRCPPAELEGLDFGAVIRSSVHDVSVDAGPAVGLPLGFGAQVDVRELAGGVVDVDGGDQGGAAVVTASMVAGYIAKYATKAAESFGLDGSIRMAEASRVAGLRPHVARMILAGEQLAGGSGFEGLERWLHMLGFRGHFTTKSRCFSVTLGALRQVRADYRAELDDRRRNRSAIGGPTRRANCDDAATRRTVPTSAGGEDAVGGSVAGDAATRRVNCLDDATRRAVPTSTDTQDGDDGPTAVVGEWRFLGLGHLTAGDALLAARAHAEHLEHLTYAAEARQL